MKILAFDTSTEVMSIAVQHGADVFEFTGTGGAQASSRLIPEIQILMQQAGLAFKDLDTIAFGAGPGAFTGLRASCAVAQGLGFAAGVPLCPINTLHAVALARYLAAASRVSADGDRVDRITAALDARMGEVYWQRFDFANDPNGAALDADPQLSKADTQVDGANFEFGTPPTARILLGLASTMLANGLAVRPADALPLYVRNKVAETTAERESTKANKEAALIANPDAAVVPAPTVIPAQAGIHL
jgi:tRNA threonylcarbamoyladenosine biosynthesis protein TsaB